MRHRAQLALQAAKRRDPAGADHYARLYAAALAGAAKRPDAAEILFQRVAIVCEIGADAVTWNAVKPML
jgi:hypothetical protein